MAEYKVLKIPKDPMAFDVRLREPRTGEHSCVIIGMISTYPILCTTVELGKPTPLSLDVFSGRNDIASVTLKLSSAGVTYVTAEATTSAGA